MKMIRHFTPQRQPLCMVIGSFDGIHRGHQTLIDAAMRHAQSCGLATAMMTFYPHPAKFFNPNFTELFSLRQRVAQIKKCGLDYLYLIAFNRDLVNMSAEDYAHRLFRALTVRAVFVGGDFRFGLHRRGDVDLLRSIGRDYGAEVFAAPLESDGESVISSQRIRERIQHGEFSQATRLLSFPWEIQARVERGRQIGQRQLVPTANLAVRHILPCCGIFAARCYIAGDEREYPTALSIGRNPTITADGLQYVEAHLIDEEHLDLYGRFLRVVPIEKIRDEIRYDSIDRLHAAINDDIAAIRSILSKK